MRTRRWSSLRVSRHVNKYVCESKMSWIDIFGGSSDSNSPEYWYGGGGLEGKNNERNYSVDVGSKCWGSHKWQRTTWMSWMGDYTTIGGWDDNTHWALAVKRIKDGTANPFYGCKDGTANCIPPSGFNINAGYDYILFRKVECTGNEGVTVGADRNCQLAFGDRTREACVCTGSGSAGKRYLKARAFTEVLEAVGNGRTCAQVYPEASKNEVTGDYTMTEACEPCLTKIEWSRWHPLPVNCTPGTTIRRFSTTLWPQQVARDGAVVNFLDDSETDSSGNVIINTYGGDRWKQTMSCPRANSVIGAACDMEGRQSIDPQGIYEYSDTKHSCQLVACSTKELARKWQYVGNHPPPGTRPVIESATLSEAIKKKLPTILAWGSAITLSDTDWSALPEMDIKREKVVIVIRNSLSHYFRPIGDEYVFCAEGTEPTNIGLLWGGRCAPKVGSGPEGGCHSLSVEELRQAREDERLKECALRDPRLLTIGECPCPYPRDRYGNCCEDRHKDNLVDDRGVGNCIRPSERDYSDGAGTFDGSGSDSSSFDLPPLDGSGSDSPTFDSEFPEESFEYWWLFLIPGVIAIIFLIFLVFTKYKKNGKPPAKIQNDIVEKG